MRLANDSVARMWAADSLAQLIGMLDLDRLPAAEGQALAECQARAVDSWLADYAELRSAPRTTAAAILLPATGRRDRRGRTAA
jgi:hypothetical protein